ncbi:hypothetical protein BHM03_00000571 [Ensete ventricosum]|nr:hypothetical protein BHM03_00000571 [Ensete ventricosum]
MVKCSESIPTPSLLATMGLFIPEGRRETIPRLLIGATPSADPQGSYNAFLDAFGLSIDALEAGLWFPLHPMIEAYLIELGISPSHIAPNSWCYLVAFLGECHRQGLFGPGTCLWLVLAYTKGRPSITSHLRVGSE